MKTSNSVDEIFDHLVYQVARTLHYISATIEKYEIDDAMLIDLNELAEYVSILIDHWLSCSFVVNCRVFEGIKGLIERQKGRWRIVKAIMANDDVVEANRYSARLVEAQTFYMVRRLSHPLQSYR